MKFDFPFRLLKPWVELNKHGDSLVAELKKELREDGLLFGASFKAIACRGDCDDVLFKVRGREYKFAVVHLTWCGKKDPNKVWPFTTPYSDLKAWKSECMEPDHEDFTS